MRKTAVVVGDLHAGGLSAVWPTDAHVEGGGRYEPNAAQAWLYRQWQTMLQEVKALRPDAVIVNGDTIQGADRKDNSLISTNFAVQIAAARLLLRPLRECCSQFYCIRGTEFHDGRSAQQAESLAESLDAEIDPATEQHSRWELWLNLGGVVVHVKHAVGTTSIPQSEGSAPLRDLLALRGELSRAYGAKAPDLRAIVRSHRHRTIHVEVPPDLHAVCVTGWQLATAFSYAKVGTLPQIGYAVLTVEDNVLGVRLRTFPLPRLRMVEVG